ncbi:MAG: response regulator [Candidatus Methanoperedens sp.]|nr:response regulator [Candidatus Methanoperedens sp.]
MKDILVIEDDRKMRDGLVEILKDEGYKVESAENGQSGLDKLKTKDFDVVLTDLMMPVMGGMEVLREIKRTKPKTSVIIITAFGTIENAVDAIKVGASDYITKPFKIDEIQTK